MKKQGFSWYAPNIQITSDDGIEILNRFLQKYTDNFKNIGLLSKKVGLLFLNVGDLFKNVGVLLKKEGVLFKNIEVLFSPIRILLEYIRILNRPRPNGSIERAFFISSTLAIFKYKISIRRIFKKCLLYPGFAKSCFNHHLSLQGETKRGCFYSINKIWFCESYKSSHLSASGG